ncbi:MAG: DUF1416 domain-containing protein [Bacteroidota bacterium]
MNKNLLIKRILAFLLLVLIFAGLPACKKYDNPIDNGNGANKGTVSGTVTTTNKIAISGVEVRVGNLVAYTNNKGSFLLSGVSAGDKVIVSFTMDNYTTTQKIVTVKAGRVSYVDASVIPVGKKQNLDALNGGTVQFNGASVVLLPNSIVDSRSVAFTGTATVKATYFDPSNNVFYGCFPGEFEGLRNDNSVTQIESFGFIAVELLNGTEKLQLASGKPATITMPITQKQQATAPQTIPLWYFDESRGQWIEEGSANKVGNNYVGTVRHFSNWNCDQPTQTSYFQGKVVDNNGNPVSCASVKSVGVDYTGQASAITADDGSFKIAVKSNSTATVFAKYHIFTSTSADYATPATSQITDIGNLIINIDTMNVVVITGRVVDNGNQPLEYISLKLLDSTNKVVDLISSSRDGRFKLFGLTNSKYVIEIATYNADTSTTKVRVDVQTGSQNETKDVGDIKLDIGGSYITGRVLDSNSMPAKNAYVYLANQPSSGTREKSTDSLGVFKLSVRPNISVDIHFYYMQKSKTLTVTSGALGETKDIGDVIVP